MANSCALGHSIPSTASSAPPGFEEERPSSTPAVSMEQPRLNYGEEDCKKDEQEPGPSANTDGSAEEDDRQSYPMGQRHVPLTSIPTLGQALIDGNTIDRKYVHSFLQVLADHSQFSDKYQRYEEDEYERKRKRKLRESERKMFFYSGQSFNGASREKAGSRKTSEKSSSVNKKRRRKSPDDNAERLVDEKGRRVSTPAPVLPSSSGNCCESLTSPFSSPPIDCMQHIPPTSEGELWNDGNGFFSSGGGQSRNYRATSMPHIPLHDTPSDSDSYHQQHPHPHPHGQAHLHHHQQNQHQHHRQLGGRSQSFHVGDISPSVMDFCGQHEQSHFPSKPVDFFQSPPTLHRPPHHNSRGHYHQFQYSQPAHHPHPHYTPQPSAEYHLHHQHLQESQLPEGELLEAIEGAHAHHHHQHHYHHSRHQLHHRPQESTSEVLESAWISGMNPSKCVPTTGELAGSESFSISQIDNVRNTLSAEPTTAADSPADGLGTFPPAVDDLMTTHENVNPLCHQESSPEGHRLEAEDDWLSSFFSDCGRSASSSMGSPQLNSSTSHQQAPCNMVAGLDFTSGFDSIVHFDSLFSDAEGLGNRLVN